MANHAIYRSQVRKARRARKRNAHFLLVMFLSALALITAHRVLDAHTGNPPAVYRTATQQEYFDAGQTDLQEDELAAPRKRIVYERVGRGDTLSVLLQRHDVPMKSVTALTNASKSAHDLTRHFRVGQLIRLTFDTGNKLTTMEYEVSPQRTLVIASQGNNLFEARMEATPFVGNTRISPSESPTNPITVSSNRDKEETGPRVVNETVRPGDVLTGVLGRRNISWDTSLAVAKAAKPVFDLARHLQPGRTVQLVFGETGRLNSLTYPLADDRLLKVDRLENGRFNAHFEKKNYDVKIKSVTGVINDSLFLTAKRQGLSQPVAVKLAGLFEWDVDFARDIRKGDRFTVVFETLYQNGKFIKNGEILAAEFINKGHKLQVVRYTNPDGHTGYYDSKGQNIEKMFIRAPVDFTRISSRFSSKRKHPVFGFTRAHKGVDYAAPKGTPIRSSGNGKVVFKGRKGGFGNLVIIRHNSKYTTAYAHMTRYARNLKRGQRVKQGQVIGYVGATGAATGPHLHYEVRVNGKQVNPLSIQMPSKHSISPKHMKDFRARTRTLLAQSEPVSTEMAALSLKNN
ncbi:MAG: peptidoglycan DD-metalloendopeptidase family protein [Magnetococcales bacterium]|nr:peptidoglycan DD-metalloendopeptidase family protein [Magnetococcales bacterium]